MRDTAKSASRSLLVLSILLIAFILFVSLVGPRYGKWRWDSDASIIVATYLAFGAVTFLASRLASIRRWHGVVVGILVMDGILMAGTATMLLLWALGQIPIPPDSPKWFVVTFFSCNAAMVVAYVWAVCNVVRMRSSTA